MKVVALVGSPHGAKGNTARLLDIVLQGVEEKGAETERILLSKSRVLPCTACDVCHKTGRCPQDDAFEEIRAKISDADALILACPNYIFNVSAQMKAFMDRCCGVVHCLGFQGKFGASVVTSGGGGDEQVAEIQNRFLMSTGIVPVGSVWATMGAIQGSEFPEEVRRAAVDLGETLVDACSNKTAYPAAEEWIGSFRQRMKALVEYRKEEWGYEYRYWRALQETL